MLLIFAAILLFLFENTNILFLFFFYLENFVLIMMFRQVKIPKYKTET